MMLHCALHHDDAGLGMLKLNAGNSWQPLKTCRGDSVYVSIGMYVRVKLGMYLCVYIYT